MIQTDITKSNLAAKKLAMSKQVYNVDPFALLRVYTIGTRDLFSDDLVSRILKICATKDVLGYLKLSSELDSLSKNYETESSELVKGHRTLCSLLKKYPFTNVKGLDPKQTSINNWLAAEEQCKNTNERLRPFVLTGRDIPSFIHRARKLIRDCIGKCDSNRQMKILANCEHGGGSVLETTSFSYTSPYFKFGKVSVEENLNQLKVTSAARYYSFAAISMVPRWVDYLEGLSKRKEIPYYWTSRAVKQLMLFKDSTEIAEHERIAHVFKSALTMRPIGIGASLNMFLQLAVKSDLEACLKKVGVDLTDQTKNQEMARLGSIVSDLLAHCDLDQYSTVDLKSASDTIAELLVKLLLPEDWFDFLNALRHKGGVDEDGHVHHYNKFSAMGNGFTFPLESLIFWAIAKATAEDEDVKLKQRDLAVYGDDIIVPLRVATPLVRNLEWCGFTVNTDKSFFSGHFKESCGGDYYRGTNVRPFYLKRELTSQEDIYFVCNRLLPASLATDRHGAGNRAIYTFLFECLAPNSRNYVPLSSVYSLRALEFEPGMYSRKKISKSISDCIDGLAVPFSFISNDETSNCFLTTRDKVKLFNSGYFGYIPKDQDKRQKMLQGIINCNLPCYLQTIKSPVRYKAKRDLQLYLMYWQSKKSEDDMSPYSNQVLKDMISSNGQVGVTLRDSYRYVSRLTFIPSWDGWANQASKLRHPIWACTI